MSRLRVLYLDVPFENEPGGDKNRSRFLWHALRERCDVNVALMRQSSSKELLVNPSNPPVAVLPTCRPPFPRSASILAFAPESHDQFLALIQRGHYDLLFSRFCTGWELCWRAAQKFPELGVVVDVDMLSSRLAALSWAANPCFSRRWFLFEKWKLQHFEKGLFREPWLFLFTNPTELAEARDRIAPAGATAEFALLPNTMPRAAELPQVVRKPVILFFGSMDSAANRDAFLMLVDEILPRLKADLEQRGAEIHVVGKNPPPAFRERLEHARTDRVKIIGAVESIDRALAESLFVLLPLRIASGTRTRILEAAAQARSVITTSIGAEGLDLGDSILIGDTAQEIAHHARSLLAQQETADRLGRLLQRQAVSRYASDKVAADLVLFLESFVSRRRRGAR